MNVKYPLTGSVKITGNIIGGNIQSDHAQNDSTQPDYIKNRLAYIGRKFDDIIPVEYEQPVLATITESDFIDNFAVKIADLPENTTPAEMVNNFCGWVTDGEEIRVNNKELFSIAERAEMQVVNFGLVDGETKGALFSRSGLPIFIVTSADNLEYILHTVDYGEEYEYHFTLPEKGIYSMITSREPDENGIIKYKSFDKILFRDVQQLNEKFIPDNYVTVDEIPENPDLLNGFTYENEQLKYNGKLIGGAEYPENEKNTLETVASAFDFKVNLFDKSTVTTGSFIYNNEIREVTGYYFSDYIEVKPSTYYIIPCTAANVGCCFDENKGYISNFRRKDVSQPFDDKTIILTPSTAKYIRVNGYEIVGTASVTCLITEYMVIEGSVYPANYIPYNGLKPTIKPECIVDDKDYTNETNRSNILYGKTLLTIGDSITEGIIIGTNEETGYAMTYGGLTAYRNNMTFVNAGWSGGTIANNNNKPFIKNGNINVALGDIVPDYLTVWYGWNDYGRGVPLGDINSTDETTYYGAWNIALNLLIRRYPTTKIGVVVPYGMSAEWRQAVRDVAKKWGVPYLDLYENQSCIFDNESGVEPSISALRKATFLADGCHPNSTGYEWLSTMYEAFLRRI